MGKLFAVVVAIINARLDRDLRQPPLVVAGRHFHTRARHRSSADGDDGDIGHPVCALAIGAGGFAWRYGDRKDGRKVKTFPGGAVPMSCSPPSW